MKIPLHPSVGIAKSINGHITLGIFLHQYRWTWCALAYPLCAHLLIPRPNSLHTVSYLHLHGQYTIRVAAGNIADRKSRLLSTHTTRCIRVDVGSNKAKAISFSSSYLHVSRPPTRIVMRRERRLLNVRYLERPVSSVSTTSELSGNTWSESMRHPMYD